MSIVYIYRYICKGKVISQVDIRKSWQEIRIGLDGGVDLYDVRQFGRETDESPWCFQGKDYVPISISITPLADTFGTYKYEIEISPLYLVK